MKPLFLFGLICSFFFLIQASASADAVEIHPVQQGETALAIAIERGLTMEQLQQLNPGVDLEMMRVGDPMILPKEGYDSFEEFLTDYYGEALEVLQCTCNKAADDSAQCFYRLKNIGDETLSNITLKCVSDGYTAEVQTALVQLLPGEELPGYVGLTGKYSDTPSCKLSVTSLERESFGRGAFRIQEGAYSESHRFLAGKICSEVNLNFTPQSAAELAGSGVNVLSGAYAEDGTLIGVRSFFGDFITPLTLTVCAVNGQAIAGVRTFAEAYRY